MALAVWDIFDQTSAESKQGKKIFDISLNWKELLHLVSV